MKVAVLTSISSNVAELASLTVPNKFEYCLRHGYSLVIHNQPYDEAIGRPELIEPLFDMFDLVWHLDNDAIVTDMTKRIEGLPCLGPHMTVCEEGIVNWNLLNCGSYVFRSTPRSRSVLHRIAASRGEWERMPCVWQTWLEVNRESLGDALTVAPLRAFNSCVWNRPANARDEVGGNWQYGDFVYHTCGVFPHSERVEWMRRTLDSGVKR